ncbi:hypothetical protein GW17_00055339 [Ensete ventricosum]|nr:hypothetical protein GW17_00055339 [Ensete ventricosum]
MSYARNLSRISDKFRSFQSYLMWMCIDQSDIRHAMRGQREFIVGNKKRGYL